MEQVLGRRIGDAFSTFRTLLVIHPDEVSVCSHYWYAGYMI